MLVGLIWSSMPIASSTSRAPRSTTSMLSWAKASPSRTQIWYPRVVAAAVAAEPAAAGITTEPRRRHEVRPPSSLFVLSDLREHPSRSPRDHRLQRGNDPNQG